MNASRFPWRSVVFLALLFCASLRTITDPDYFTHLAMGRAFVGARSLTVSEPFVAWGAGRPMGTEEWPFQVLVHLLRELGGDAAGSFMVAFAAVLSFMPIVRRDERGEVPIPLLGFAASAAAVAAHRFSPRPEVLAYPLFSLLLATTFAFVEHPSRGKLLGLAAILAVWSRFHPSWTLGAALSGVALVFCPRLDFWRREVSLFTGRIFTLACVAGGALAALRIASFGAMVVRELSAGGVLATISEMRPVWEFPAIAVPLALLTLAAIGLSLCKPGGWRLSIFVLVAFLPAWFVARNVAFGAIAVTFAAARALSNRSFSGELCASGGALAALFVALFFPRQPCWGLGVDWDFFPHRAAATVTADPRPPVYNRWDCGGYLAWAWNGTPKTFLDGRQGPPGAMADHDAIEDATAPDEALRRRDFRTVFLQGLYRNSGRIVPAVPWFLASGEWSLSDASDALVFVKGADEALPAADAWREIVRETHVLQKDGGEGKRHLLYSRGIGLLYSGQRAEAAAAFAEATRLHPELCDSYSAVVSLAGRP